MRLVNGSSPAEGRIEVFYQGKWGTVCGTNATFDLAIVVCRQLGYRETVALKTNAYFGRGSGPVWLEPACYAGINSTVVDCIHAGWGETACDHSQDVGVICSGEPTLHSFICTCAGSFILYVHLKVPLYVHVHVPLYVHVHVPLYIHVHVHVPLYVHVHVHVPLYLHVHVPLYVHVHVPLYLHVHVYAYFTHTILQRLYP